MRAVTHRPSSRALSPTPAADLRRSGLLAAALLPLLALSLACGGQTAGNQEQPPAATGGDAAGTTEPLPENTTAADADATEATPTPAGDTLPGPLGAGPQEAEGTMRIVIAAGGEPMELTRDIPVRMTLTSRTSDRGHEFLAAIRTLQSREEGGFLYFTGGTAGDGVTIPPVPGTQVIVGEDDQKRWHYGVLETQVQVGLMNLQELIRLMGEAYAHDTTLPADLPVDMFEAIIDRRGSFALTAGASLPNGHRLVLNAEGIMEEIWDPEA